MLPIDGLAGLRPLSFKGYAHVKSKVSPNYGFADCLLTVLGEGLLAKGGADN